MTLAPMDCVRIVGGPGRGKTYELLARARSALGAGDAIVASPLPVAAQRLRAALPNATAPWHGATLAPVAFAILRTHALGYGLPPELARIDDVDAEAAFEAAAASLFALEWVELGAAEIGAESWDFEVAGLRAPERFAQAAFRLIRKLRGAGIGPDRLVAIAQRKANDWYASPPNLASPDLLFATAERYRDSLGVDAAELERQRRRELDLAKILGKIYAIYVSDALDRAQLTDVDATAEATDLLAQPSIAAFARARWPVAFVDDAQDCTTGDLAFLAAIYGEKFDGVTFAGDPQQATRTFAGARPDRVFAASASASVNANHELGPARAAIVRVGQRILGTSPPARTHEDSAAPVRALRCATQVDEARAIAHAIEVLLGAGSAPERIAVLCRSLRGSRIYAEALVERNIPLDEIGDIDLFAEPDIEEGLAVLYAAAEPGRHEWLLRALQLPGIRLSDATLYLLCGEPSDGQVALFEPQSDEASDERKRSDPERRVRLSQNVVRGDRDMDLDPITRELIERFRDARARWETYATTMRLDAAARTIFAQAGLFEPRAGETTARSARRRELLERLCGRIATSIARDPLVSLSDVLATFERIAASEWPHFEPACGGRGVVMAAIEAAKGRTFDHVFVPNVRAGAFPPYWVPDAFVFTTAHGLIPKDNVGEASAARTAKFTWYSHRAKAREAFAHEDRRLLYAAMTRATQTVTISACGSPTKGTAAPELLAELEAFGKPDVTLIRS